MQPDTLISDPSNPQAFNRYSYVSNSPINYTDPSGHVQCLTQEDCDDMGTTQFGGNVGIGGEPLIDFEEEPGQHFTDEEKKTLEEGASAVAKALARDINRENRLAWKMGELDQYESMTAIQAFYSVFGGPILVKRVAAKCDCWARHIGPNADGQYVIWIYSSTSPQEITNHPRLIVHEIGHAFHWATKVAGQPLPISAMSAAGVNNRNGFAGPEYSWQLSVDMAEGEIYADMFVGWVYGRWQTNPDGSLTDPAELKSQFMTRTIWDIYGITGR